MSITTNDIIEYIEQRAQGKCRCMKWENIKALLRMTKVSNGITQEQVDFLIQKFCKK